MKAEGVRGEGVRGESVRGEGVRGEGVEGSRVSSERGTLRVEGSEVDVRCYYTLLRRVQ